MNLEDTTVLVTAGLLTNTAQDFVVVVVRHDESIKNSSPNSKFSNSRIRFLTGCNLEMSENWTTDWAPKFVLPRGIFDL